TRTCGAQAGFPSDPGRHILAAYIGFSELLMDIRQHLSLRHAGLAAMVCVAAQTTLANPCSTETLSSVFLSPTVPVDLFSNPNGNALTSEEIDEVRGSIAKIRSSLGPISSMVSVGDPYLPRSMDITVGANARATGYSYSPKSYAVETTKAGQVVITFGTATRSELCRLFWVRVSVPADNSGRANIDRNRAL
ncbi:hypothetical protein WDZ92_32990, partial [Nostoc sp. NIES-2111]